MIRHKGRKKGKNMGHAMALLTREIRAEKDLCMRNKIVHSCQIGSPCAECCVIVESPKVLQNFFRCELTAHVPREDSNTGSQERCATTQVGEDDLGIWVATFTACYDEMSRCLESLIWDLFVMP